MQSRFALPVLFVAAVAATAAFYLLSGSEGASRVPRSPTLSGAPEQAAVDPGELAVPASLADEGQRATLPRELVETTSDAGPARGAEKHVEEASGLVLLGRVVDRAGAPVEGATVLASNQSDFSLDADLGFGTRASDTTDADGRFRIEGLSAGGCAVAVRAAGFAPLDRSGISVPAEKEVTLPDLVVEEGAILVGHVLDPSGRGVAGAELVSVTPGSSGIFFFGGDRKPIATTEADGSFRVDQLALGQWTLLVRSEDHPDKSFSGITERAGEIVSGLLFRLEQGFTISGRVTGVPPAEKGKLTVRASKVAEDFLASFRGRSADVDASGRFEVRGLSGDTEYDLKVRTKRSGEEGVFGPERSRSAVVQARAGATGVELPYQPEGAIRFQLVDAETRQPIEDFTVQAGFDWKQGLRDENGRLMTHHPNGQARFGELRPANASSRVGITIEAAGYETYERDDIAVAVGQEVDLGQVFVAPVPLVRITVLDGSTGQPVAGARVTLTRERDGGDGFRSFERRVEIDTDGTQDLAFTMADAQGVTNAEGVAELTSVEGATCVLEVKSKAHAPYSEPGVTLPTGTSLERTVVLTRGGEVLVTVVEADGTPRAGESIAHRDPVAEESAAFPSFGARSEHVTNAAGQVLFERLAPGTHSFRIDEGDGGTFVQANAAIHIAGAEDSGEPWSDVDIAEGERAEITLLAKARGVLVGRVLEAGKPLTGASLTLEKASEGPRMPFGGSNDPKSRSDGDAEYEFLDVKEGDYRLVISHPTRRMPFEYEVSIRPGKNTFDVDLPLSIVEGRITDSEGAPLAGIKVKAERAQADGAPRMRFVAIAIDGDGGGMMTSDDVGGDSTTTDADGRYSLRGVQSDAELCIVCTGSAVQEKRSEPFVVRPDQTKGGIDVSLEGAGAIEVEIVDANGGPASFVIVRATWQGDGDLEPKMGFAQAGKATLSGLRPGPWLVNARSAQSGRDDPGVDAMVEVVVGQKVTAPIRLP